MNREEALDRIVYNITKWSSIPEGYGFDHWLFDGCDFIHKIYKTITIDDWNRAKIVPNTFVKVLSQEHRDLISSYLITLGGRYHGNSKADCIKSEPYLHFEEGCEGYYVDAVSLRSAHHAYKEIFIDLPETIEQKIDANCVAMGYPPVHNANSRILSEKVGDVVSKPNHYQLLPEYEVKDVNKALLDKIQLSDFDLSLYEAGWYQQSMQYFMRFYAKNGLEDLEKGVQTMQFVIDSIKGRR